MRVRWKLVAIGGGVLLTAAVLALALRPALEPVEVARAGRGDLLLTVDEEGETRVRDRYVVASPVSGRVTRIALREGDSVRTGQVVARILPAPFDTRAREEARARVAAAEDASSAAEAALATAQAAHHQARRSTGRVRELASKELVAAEELERAELEETSRRREAESADFRARAARHDVEQARAALLGGTGNALPVRAPVAGRVLRVGERSERVVAAGTELLEIGDPADLEIVADLLSSEAVRVHRGDPMLLVGWGGDRVLHGRVRLVEPSGFTRISALGVEEQRVNVVGDLLEPPGALGDRYRVEVRIVIWEGRDVLRVPASALFPKGDGWAVFQVREGRARETAVTVGHRTAFEAEITAGLAEGEPVIRNPGDRIGDGSRVRVTGAGRR